jgi:crossover junction endodeoxyribonuclease RusA
VLPYPVSANRYWRSFAVKRRGANRHSAIVALSDEARSYKSECAWIAKAAGAKPLSGTVELRITLVPANRVCMDLDNALKVTIDALKGIVYEDDAQVYRIVAERLAPDGKARLEVEALPFDMPLALERAAA